mgnify:CR=1 FL=1
MDIFTNLSNPKWQKDSSLGKWEETWRYLGSMLALIPLPPPALGNAGPESELLGKVSSYSQPVASRHQGHLLRLMLLHAHPLDPQLPWDPRSLHICEPQQKGKHFRLKDSKMAFQRQRQREKAA